MSFLPLVLACCFAPAPFTRPIHVSLGVEFAPGNEMRVLSVFAASPADRAGLRMSDVVVAVDGKKVEARADLAAVLRKKKPGNALTVAVRRANTEQTFRVTL